MIDWGKFAKRVNWPYFVLCTVTGCLFGLIITPSNQWIVFAAMAIILMLAYWMPGGFSTYTDKKKDSSDA